MVAEFKIKLKTFIPLTTYSNTEVHTIFTGKTSHSSGLFNCNEKKKWKRLCNVRPMHGFSQQLTYCCCCF